MVVIVGLNDTSELSAYPRQRGKNRFTIARNWVKDMSALAEQNGLASQIEIEMIPGKGHSMSGLAEYCQATLFPDEAKAD